MPKMFFPLSGKPNFKKTYNIRKPHKKEEEEEAINHFWRFTQIIGKYSLKKSKTRGETERTGKGNSDNGKLKQFLPLKNQETCSSPSSWGIFELANLSNLKQLRTTMRKAKIFLSNMLERNP